MDDLTLVRELESGTPAPTESARAAAHAQLVSAIAKERRRGGAFAVPVPAVSRRFAFRVAIGATVAAAVAGTTLVATGDGGPDGAGGGAANSPRMTTLSAAQVLHKAADRARSDGAGMPVPRNDQYLYTKEVTTRTWTEDGRPRTKHYTDESWLSVDGSKPSRYSYSGRILDEPALTKHEVRWPPTEYAKLKKWPTDPDALLAVFTREPEGAHSAMRSQMAFADIVMLMRGPRVNPPGLQAAAFEAAARLPDIRIDHDQVDALGRHGIGISYPKISFGLVFDPDTYAYLGLRQWGIKGQKVVDGKMTRGTKYFEVKGLVRAAVVDRMLERPPVG
jgi:hypothetical protein